MRPALNGIQDRVTPPYYGSSQKLPGKPKSVVHGAEQHYGTDCMASFDILFRLTVAVAARNSTNKCNCLMRVRKAIGLRESQFPLDEANSPICAMRI